MHIAITGANGHLGAALCRQLLEDGHNVRTMVYRKDTALRGLPVGIVRGSLQDAGSLRMLFKDAEVVYHLAGQISIGAVSKEDLWRTNVEGVERVLEACVATGVRRLVHFSSIHAFQPVPRHRVFDESAAPATDFPYERSKAAAQKMVLDFNGAGGLETISLNPTGVLGPWDYKPSLQGQMVLDLLHRRIPALTPGGFDWVDSRDVARAASAALSQGRSGETYIISGRYASMTDLAAMLGKISGRPMPRLTLPFWFLKALAPVLAGWSAVSGRRVLFTREALSHVEKGHPNVSHAKASRELGYQPRPLEETLLDTYTWLLQHKQNGK